MGGTDHLGQPIGKFALRFLILALVLIVGILGAVVLVQKGQARIAAEAAATAAAEARAREEVEQAEKTAAQPAPASEAQATAGAEPSAAGAALASDASTDAALPAKSEAQKAAEPAAPAFQVIARPAIVAAGVLETTRGRVTLKDIAPLDPVETCGQGASTWPCGQLAATQFRRFLRGRSVNCDIADPDWQGEVTAHCTLGKEDVGAWLVEQGWARAQPGSMYEEAGRKAEADRRGIFAPDPRHP
jgi:endonuclease YncB( thermonuclease family)